MDDIRFKILEELKRIGHTTEEASMNDFLSTLKTYKNTDDLGTIREAILELVKDGYVKETRDKNVVENIKTSEVAGGDDWKSPKRFIQTVGMASKIPDVYLFMTLEGKKFLIEWENLQKSSWLTKYDLVIKASFIILGALVTLGIQQIDRAIEKSQLKEQGKCSSVAKTENGKNQNEENATIYKSTATEKLKEKK